ncbi:Pentatricopeptide repeat-containing protein [Ananas comosus]|uniref:Pentatricopeptide repeat-containing protein n=1 Tax=Ananas comosus TaxID=4615 RepID=A0A199UR53_ANACO|nr:Pentatricopeptide repeat-containing protein [Ananas comosus]
MIAAAALLLHRRCTDAAGLVSALYDCARRRPREAGAVHALLVTSGALRSSPSALTALISAYSALSLPALALRALVASPLPPNLVSFNAAITALASHSLPSAALGLFRRLRRALPDEPPDAFSFPPVLRACADLPAPHAHLHLRALHALLLKSRLHRDLFVASALVRSYLRLRLPDDAAHLFDELPRRDVVLWNALLNGLAQLGRFGPALECFRRMLGAGVAPSKFTVTGILSVFTATADLGSGRKVHAFAVKAAHDREASVANALVDLYGKCHELGDATEVFASIADDDRDLFSWNSMLCALHYSADNVGVLRLLAHMRRSAIWPDAVTMAAVLPACAHMAALRLGREIHGFLVTSGMFGNNGGGSLDVFAANALEDMYAKSGALEDARRVFDRMPERDTASWNIMIDGYASHGRGGEALRLFDRMTAVEKLAPDAVTLLGALTACSHARMVEEGRALLRRMREEFSVEPEAEHYACAADMLGRAGRLEEAKQVAEKAGEAGAWRAYLAACRMHGEAGMAEEAARRMLEFEGAGSGGWVLLANAYGSAGSFEGLEEVRGEMRRRGVRKAAPGCSWVEVGAVGVGVDGAAAGEGRTVHVFVSGDREHPEMERIYQMLHGLVGRMRECGYVPDLNI